MSTVTNFTEFFRVQGKRYQFEGVLISKNTSKRLVFEVAYKRVGEVDNTPGR